VPPRDREAQDVGHHAGVAVGHRTRERREVLGEHGFGRDHLADEPEPPVELGLLDPFEQEPVDLLAGEPQPQPAAGHGLLVERVGDEVVEGPVEVGERHVDVHPGDGQGGRGP
jgi:hypothetical protein